MTRPKSNDPGTSVATAAARRERPFMLTTYLLPLLGSIAALALFPYLPFGWVELTLCVSLYIITMLGIEVGYHRLFTHRSFEASPAMRAFLAIAGSMAAEGPPIRWATVHRIHHDHSDRPGDPHSPHCRQDQRLGVIRGLWNGSFGWLFVEGSWLGLDLTHYPKYLLRDRQLMWINMRYFLWVSLGIALPTLIGGLAHRSWLGAVSGFLWGGMVRIFLTHLAIASVNSLGHVTGAQPFRTHDGSRNIGLLALPTLGASWHNTHHAFPGIAVVGLRWWQVDLGGLFVRAARFCGLVSRFNVANKQMIESKSLQPDESRHGGSADVVGTAGVASPKPPGLAMPAGHGNPAPPESVDGVPQPPIPAHDGAPLSPT